jgi:nucleoside-diphosphate-sugar epimerase
MKPRVLVTGGAGYIGGYTVDLLSKDYDVIVYDNLLYEERYLKNVDFIYGDVRDTQKLLDACKDVDVVVFLAAIVGDPACNVNQKLTQEVNYESVKNICEKLPFSVHFIFASTCSVYGTNMEHVDENSLTKPLSSYASTKLAAEKHVTDIGGTIFRLGTVYGVGDQFSRIRADLVVNTLTIKAFTEKEITINGGNQWRPIISVKDIGFYIKEACERKKAVESTFNLGYENTTILELGKKIKERFPEIKMNIVKEMFQDERNYKVLVDKVNNTFYYKAGISIDEEVSELRKLLVEGRIKNPANVNYNNGLFLAQQRL